MKTYTTQLISAIAMITAFSSHSVFAQLKIGTNPTTIGTNNNLEVEGTIAGRKTSIDKTTGKVTIADGTQGKGKVLSSDAGGSASWAPTANASQVSFFAVFDGFQSFISDDSYNKINFNNVLSNVGNGYNLVTDAFTAPVAGIYYFIGTAYMDSDETEHVAGAIIPDRDVICIKINGIPGMTQESNHIRQTVDNGRGILLSSAIPGSAISIAYHVRLSVGDIVELFAYSNKQNPRFNGVAQTNNAPQTTFQGFLIGQ